MQEVVWSPSDGRVAQSSMLRFMLNISVKYGLDLRTYEELHAWSVENLEIFWSECWDFVGVLGEKGDGPTLLHPRNMLDAVFFANGHMNFAENCLRNTDSLPAIVYAHEEREEGVITRAEFATRVFAVARWLRVIGVEKGDRVCAVVCNVPEAVVCMLATLSIGAVWSSVSPDFGVEGVTERFSQISPRVLFYSGHYYNKQKLFDVKGKIVEIEKKLKACSPGMQSLCISNREAWDALLETPAAVSGELFQFAKTSFNDPAFIMFSSGTTGRPKCIVHRHGVLLQLMKEHQLHCDIKPGDRMFYYTTTAWMMWNWLVAGLASGATIVLYEGNAFFPNCNRLFEYSGKHACSVFGVSSKYIDSLKLDPLFGAPPNQPFLDNVSVILSTGSVLVPESFDFVYSAIKRDVMLSGICGGTDIISCFILGCPLKPVKRGYVQCRGLGMDVRVVNSSISNVDAVSPSFASPGTKGELVCCSPFPSQPIGFWGDDTQNSLYRKTYFAPWENVWKQGDFVSMDGEGHVIVFGRSDATLKPGGVRIGTAEIYRAVESLNFVKESVCCGIELKPGDESVALFVVLRDGDGPTILTDEMRNLIRATILRFSTRHHVPKLVEQVHDIPRTRNGKLAELAVKQILQSDESSSASVGNINALINPESLEEYKRWRHVTG